MRIKLNNPWKAFKRVLISNLPFLGVCVCVCVCTYMQLCVLSCFRLTLCDPMHCSPPAPLFMGIRQAGILEWLPMPPSGVFPTQGSELRLFSPVLAGGFFTTSAAWETLSIYLPYLSIYN